MKKNAIIIILFLLMCSSSCSRERYPFDARGLTFKGLFVYESQFRIDGVYYHVREDGGLSVRYFFKDGSFYSAGHGNFDIESIECPQITARVRDIPYAWGFYIVEGDIIRMQTLDPTSRHRNMRRFMVEEWQARIENDTTIRVFKRIFPEGNSRSHDLVFRFRQCENRPDSMNILLR